MFNKPQAQAPNPCPRNPQAFQRRGLAAQRRTRGVRYLGGQPTPSPRHQKKQKKRAEPDLGEPTSARPTPSRLHARRLRASRFTRSCHERMAQTCCPPTPVHSLCCQSLRPYCVWNNTPTRCPLPAELIHFCRLVQSTSLIPLAEGTTLALGIAA